MNDDDEYTSLLTSLNKLDNNQWRNRLRLMRGYFNLLGFKIKFMSVIISNILLPLYL